jgi:hypothetical protein
MYEAPVVTAAEEKDLLQEWFDTVHFDVEDTGIPALDPEDDDEESRSFAFQLAEKSVLDSLPMDDLMEELRKRDPENPF